LPIAVARTDTATGAVERMDFTHDGAMTTGVTMSGAVAVMKRAENTPAGTGSTATGNRCNSRIRGTSCHWTVCQISLDIFL